MTDHILNAQKKDIKKLASKDKEHDNDDDDEKDLGPLAKSENPSYFDQFVESMTHQERKHFLRQIQAEDKKNAVQNKLL